MQPAVRTEATPGALYLQLSPDAVHANLHLPAQGARAELGVVLCPPFGWDELCSYRSRRWLAQSLAEAGHAALRIDLPGTGDSAGSPLDPDRFGAWTGAVAGAGQWLREAVGCRRVAAFGIGLGGIVACEAVRDGAPIEDLVLWSVPASGRRYLRELRAFAGVAGAAEEPPGTEAVPPVVDDGALEVAGFALGEQTCSALERFDLTSGELPNLRDGRALLLGRDETEPDKRLRDNLTQSGWDVEVRPGHGYGAMMTHPQFAKTPRETLGRVTSWLGEGPRDRVSSSPGAGSVPIAERKMSLQIDGTRIYERPLEIEHPAGSLAGVLAEPADGPRCDVSALLLSAGAIRRIGPNRIWTETARRWASWGVPTLRLDVEGVGDADGDETLYYDTGHFYRPSLTEQALGALDALAAEALPERFVVGGLCSGAYWSFHAALADERVVSLMLVNLWNFFWSEHAASERDVQQAWALLKHGRLPTIARIALTEGRIRRLVRTRMNRARHSSARAANAPSDVDGALDRLRDREVQTLLLLSRDEALEDFLVQTGRMNRLEQWPNVRLERIPIADHIFRPRWAQAHAGSALDRALRETLAQRSSASA